MVAGAEGDDRRDREEDPGGWASLVCRKRYIDDQLLGAVTKGVDEVVILGAGFDTRAYRPDIERAVYAAR